MNELPQDCDDELVTLFCAKLNLEIEFKLSKGSFARIGSSEEMEIVVPILGVDAQAVRLDRDVSGNLIATDGQSSHLATAATGIWVGPHHFALTGSRPQALIAPRVIPVVPVALHPFQERPRPLVKNPTRWRGLGSTGKWIAGPLNLRVASQQLADHLKRVRLLGHENRSHSWTESWIQSGELPPPIPREEEIASRQCRSPGTDHSAIIIGRWML